MSCENISTRKIDYYVNNPYASIIDLRDEEDYRQMHIKGSINVPFNLMEVAINGLCNYHMNIRIKGIEYDKNTIMVFYCTRGSQSMMICSRLSGWGYTCKSLVGGIKQYRGKYLVQN